MITLAYKFHIIISSIKLHYKQFVYEIYMITIYIDNRNNS